MRSEHGASRAVASFERAAPRAAAAAAERHAMAPLLMFRADAAMRRRHFDFVISDIAAFDIHHHYFTTDSITPERRDIDAAIFAAITLAFTFSAAPRYPATLSAAALTYAADGFHATPRWLMPPLFRAPRHGYAG